MTQDIATVIDSLRDETVGRCRERIEKAGLRAKTLVTSKGGSPKLEPVSRLRDEHGVTSLLKRRHGL